MLRLGDTLGATGGERLHGVALHANRRAQRAVAAERVAANAAALGQLPPAAAARRALYYIDYLGFKHINSSPPATHTTKRTRAERSCSY